ncbi:MAG: HAMP domain-containing histidine kinase [Ignavibacteriales bacterium]|nr:HAMP domain-containing histidine kinase [Ignavibacteriales bacterium]
MTGIVFPALYFYFLRPLTREITERKKTQDALEMAKEKAELADRLKTEFLGQMSHEIRTPINQILGYAQIIKEIAIVEPETELLYYFEKLENGSRRLMRTIESILEMSQLKIGAYTPLLVQIDLKSVLDDLYSIYLKKAQEKGLIIQRNIGDGDYFIIGDKYGVEQVFRHLIENAIIFTEQGEIRLVLDRNEKHLITLSITDTGVGISEEFLPNIFQAFSQEHQGYTRSYEGNGIGLALVNGYCSINNADVIVYSSKGKGSTFEIVFNE